MDTPVLNQLTNTLIQKLKAHHIDLLYYEAYGTDSRYIKMDDGMLHSIRISNHPGKKHLKYRYEIGPHIDHKYCIHKQGFPCYKYSPKEIDQLIEDILHERKQRMKTYGPHMYTYYRNQNIEENKNKKGFWTKAKPV